MADFRKANDLNDQVLEAVNRRTPAAENLSILSVQDKFLDGKLFTVGFESPPDPEGVRKSYVNRVYVTKYSIEPYGHDESVLQIVGARYSRGWYDFFANGQVISGCIAIIVTILVVPAYLVSYVAGTVIEVPNWITSGWLLILGFYFGKASTSDD